MCGSSQLVLHAHLPVFEDVHRRAILQRDGLLDECGVSGEGGDADCADGKMVSAFLIMIGSWSVE